MFPAFFLVQPRNVIIGQFPEAIEGQNVPAVEVDPLGPAPATMPSISC